MPFDLRLYQIEAVEKTKAAIVSKQAILVHLPTGGGKTVFAAHLISEGIKSKEISPEHPVVIISKSW